MESAQDILEELQPFASLPPRTLQLVLTPCVDAPGDVTGGNPMPAERAGEISEPVLHAMGFDPVGHDALAARCGVGSAELAVLLLSLELDGLIEMLPGGKYQRIR